MVRTIARLPISAAFALILIASAVQSLELRAGGDVPTAEDFYDELHAESRDGYILGALENLDAATILQAAEYGVPEAQCALGTMCEEGVGVDKNETAAAEWYLQAAMSGFIGGMYNLAGMYWRGLGVDKDDSKAALWFREAAAQLCDLDGYCKRHYLSRFRWGQRELRVVRGEDPRSLEKVVDAASGEVIWEDGQDDQVIAEILASSAPYEEDIRAMENLPYNLITVWGRDAGVDLDAMMPHGAQHTKGVVDFAAGRAWAGGDYGAQEDSEELASALLSFMVRRGQEDHETERARLDADPAWHNVLEALADGAAQGDGIMSAILGVLHRVGYGVDLDDETACKFFSAAADKGVPEGLNNLGVCFERGAGKPKDTARARQLYKRAAPSCPTAKANLAAMIQRGEGGVTPDPKKAAVLYEEAAKDGNGPAMNNLGVLHATGTGVEQNGAEAVRWFRKAVEVPSGVFVLNEKHAIDNTEKEGATRDLGEVPGRNSVAAALFNLGLLSESGVGVPMSAQSAARWFALAAEKAMMDSGNAEGLLL